MSAKSLAGDLRIALPDWKNVAARRPRESLTQTSVLRRGVKPVTDTPIDVQMTSQSSFEEADLLIPHTFDATPEEKEG